MDIRSKIDFFLKHYGLVQSIYRVLFSFLFRVIGMFVRTRNNLVLMNCYAGVKFSDSPMELYNYLCSHAEYDGLDIVIALDHPEKFQGNPRCRLVRQDSLEYFLTALRAKYWITNVNIERGLHFKKRTTRYLNTWHGVAFNTIGNAVPGRKDYDCSNVDVWCAEGEYQKKLFIRDFKVRPESILFSGLPRNDRLYRATAEEKEALKRKLNLPLDKKVIAYTPTWRDSRDFGKSYCFVSPMNLKVWEARLGSEYVMLFRTHHFTNKLMNVQFNDFVRDYTDYPDINDLFIVSDILISDYSACIADYSILERPVICYGYDYEVYARGRGFYTDLDEVMPNGVMMRESDVLSHIETMDYDAECQKTRRMIKERFLEYGGDATRLCIEQLFATWDKDREQLAASATDKKKEAQRLALQAQAEKTFLGLLQHSLWGSVPELPEGVWSENDYRRVMLLGREQTVAALVAKSMMDCGVLLPKRAAMDLFGRLQNVRRRNRLMNAAVVNLCREMEAHGIRIYIFKGQTLNSLYPDASLRMSGDIDFLCHPDDWQRALDFLREEWGVEPDSSISERDVNFCRDGVVYEMHSNLTVFSYPPNRRYWNDVVMADILSQQHTCLVDGYAVPTLPPTYNLLYVFVHILLHLLNDGIGVRQFCDWAMLLRHLQSEGDIDIDALKTHLKGIRAYRAYCGMGAILTDILGLPESEFGFHISSSDHRHAIGLWQNMLETGNFGQKKPYAQKRGIIHGAQHLWRISTQVRKFCHYAPAEALFEVPHLLRYWGRKFTQKHTKVD
ncbi:MAG: CDP-glycerol glycerophosphotransferase family protein [Bacteroidaceae bacterium]|nr:CDP-glycerol glycerophosphotransferase family protein [Bacteroidaceae bacterium]